MGYNAGMQTRVDSKITWWLLLIDWLVILLFVFIGQMDHGSAGVNGLPSLLNTTAAIGAAWTVSAYALGALRLEPTDTARNWLGRVLPAWLIAAFVGLVLRALLRGQGAIPTVFILVMTGIGGLFLIGWRLLYFALSRRKAGPGAA